jgi:outer membrane autotransporter protein
LTFKPGNLSKTAAPANLASWRATLATSVASAALLAYGARPVRAQTVPPAAPCDQISGVGGSIVTCSGNLSSGVDVTNGAGPFQVLNVQNLTAAIAPSSGVTGILFTSNGSVALNVDPGPFGIFATDADGIFAASNSGAVTITSTADIVTSGGSATGIQGSVQSAALTIVSSGTITTSGNNAFGIAAGSVYGDITVTSTGDISTAGTFAAAINVGSIGTLNTAQGAITINSSGTITTTGNSANGINAASVYGPITINSSSDINVSGNNSLGISAQSNGDITITSQGDITAGPNSSTAIRALSQSGNVVLKSFGDISTAGDGGVGLYAIAADATASVFSYGKIVTHGFSAPGIAASGYGGTAVVSTGDIRTDGDSSPGITAYGSGDIAVGSSGNITTTGAASDGINVVSTDGMAVVVSSGDISATGTGSAGIYAAGYAGTIVMNRGNVVGGPCCAGVMQASAAANQLLNWGTITAGLSDYAIDSVGDSNAVVNYGTITGDVRLFDTGGGSSFTNEAGALFNMGTAVIAGSLVNDGTLAPGGKGVVQTTSLTGDLIQNAGGVLAVDVNGAASTSDRITASGSATLAGKVQVNFVSLPTSAVQNFTILTATSGVTNNGLSVSATPALQATLSFSNPNTVVLGIDIDFAAGGLDRNGRVIADRLNSAFAAGGGGVAAVLSGLLNTVAPEDYRAAIDELQPTIYQDTQVAALYANLAFANALMSCRVNGSDTASVIREGQCLWAGANARFLDSDGTSQQPGFKETAGLFTAGAQFALDDVWRLGFAAGYQSSNLYSTNGATSDGEQAQAGVALKYNSGPLLLAGALTAGRAWNDIERTLTFGGFDAVAEGDQHIDIFSGALRAAYVFGAPSLYFKPLVDVSATRLDFDDLKETAGGGAALNVEGSGQTVFAVTPALEVGTEWWWSNGTLVRPFVRAGATWYDGVDTALTASFAAAPDGVGAFTIRTDVDDVMGVVGAGLDLINGEDSALRFTYDGQLGETTQIHSVGIKGSAKF